ncbi:3-oxoacyl-ACP synthase [Actinophytocola sp. S1-96]|uniref:3-oxoacyl-ACP synthase n=2 Tax=Actinophytocola gossypii TaxID=2812003 RepID=A0ABT2J7T1_9PSEU|nr:3-oxoacyl-ACP synthase [Actinophytocola gossypii]
MIERAARPMFERLGLDPAGNVDLLLTNVLLPDNFITGAGADAARLLGCDPELVLDVHNSGCASFPYMLKLARSMVVSGEARRVLVANVQNTAGQVYAQPELSGKNSALTAGDGCGVAYVTADGPSPVLGVRVRSTPAFAEDMALVTGSGRRYWEAGAGEVEIAFTEERQAEIIERGNRLVPELVRELCDKIGVRVEDIGLLVTNQPNRIFLMKWRNTLGLSPDRHFDTFDRYGNLYAAGVPVTLATAAAEGRLRDGDLVVLAGFAHAGDFAAAAAVRWHS